MNLTVIGLGLMGTALARTLVDAGHPTTVWNRTPTRADALVARGAVRAPDLRALDGVVLLCLTDHTAVRAVLAEADVAGHAVVDLTSGTPDDARASAALLGERGARPLEGKILAIPQQIGTLDARLLLSGPVEVFEEVEPVLGQLGTTLHLGADPGTAATYDLALLGIMWSALAGFYHASALLGRDATAAFAPLAQQWLAGVAELLPDEAAEIAAGRFDTDVSTIDTNAVALTHLIAASRAAGIDTSVPGAVHELVQRRRADGHGRGALSGIVELIRTGR